MANQTQSDVDTSTYGSAVTFTGRVVTKRIFQTAKGNCVANLFVRTKTARGKFFGIGVTIWNDDAKKINNELDALLPKIADGDLIQEADAPVVTIVGELNEDSWEDKKTSKTVRRMNVNAFSITVE